MQKTEIDALIARLAAGARSGRVSRRTFMEGALAAGFGAGAATALWGTKVAAQTPKRGGTYRSARMTATPATAWTQGRPSPST